MEKEIMQSKKQWPLNSSNKHSYTRNKRDSTELKVTSEVRVTWQERSKCGDPSSLVLYQPATTFLGLVKSFNLSPYKWCHLNTEVTKGHQEVLPFPFLNRVHTLTTVWKYIYYSKVSRKNIQFVCIYRTSGGKGIWCLNY